MLCNNFNNNRSQKALKINLKKYSNEITNIILPLTIVSGTITRRAVEPTWLTASNYKVILFFYLFDSTIIIMRFFLF